MLAACLAAIGILTGLHLLNDLVGDPRTRLAIDEEGSFGVWYSCVQFFLGAALSWLVALLDTELRRPWAVLGMVLLAFSVVDVTQVHHPAENAADLTLAVLGWQPMLIVVISIVLAMAGRHAGPTARRFLLACIPCLVLAQLCSIGYNQFDPPAGVVDALGVVEEVFEMSVGALALAAAVSQLAPRFRLEPSR